MGEEQDYKTTIYIGDYGMLVRQSEQLRILKNYIRCENTYKAEYETLIKAMEVNNE